MAESKANNESPEQQHILSNMVEPTGQLTSNATKQNGQPMSIEVANGQPTNDIAESTNDIAESTNDIAESTNDIAESTNDIAESTNDIAESTNDITESTNDIAESTNDIAESIHSVAMESTQHTITISESVGQVAIQRRAHTRLTLEESFSVLEEPSTPVKQVIKQRLKKTCACSQECLKKKLYQTFPFIKRDYELKKNLVYDIISGLSVGVVHIPLGMGFSILASLPPVYGLYCSFFHPIIYFFFAMSMHNSLGSMAIPSLIIGVAVDRELALMVESMPLTSNVTDMERIGENMTVFINSSLTESIDAGTQKAAIAATMTLLAGLIQLGMAFLGLGSLMTTFMPTSFVGGFTTACAFYIAINQVPHLFGIKTHRYAGVFQLIKLVIHIFKNLKYTNPATFILSVIVIIILIILKEFVNEKYKDKLKVPIPAEIIVVILTTLISYLAKFYDRFEIINIGPIPKGFPRPSVPPMEFASNVIADSVVLAILSFVVSISMANVFTRKYKYHVDSDQEMMAYGIIHTVTSFFHCIGGACQPPSSFVFEKSGGRTNIAFLVSALLVFLVIMILGSLFQPLPKAVLGCVIIVALFPLFKQFRDLKNLWKVSKFDFLVWLVTCFFTIITDVGTGLGIGVGYVIISYVMQSRMAPGHFMGVLGSTDLSVSEAKFKTVQHLYGIRVFRFECTLYFATVQRFKKELFKGTFNPLIRKKNQEMAVKMNNVSESMNTVVTELEHNSNEVVGNPAVEGNGNEIKIETNGSCKQNGIKSITLEKTTEDIQHIIIDCSAFAFIDLMGINTLRQVKEDFEAVGVKISLINLSPEFRQRLWNVGLVGEGGGAFQEFPTIQDALAGVSETHSPNVLHSVQTTEI